MTVTDRLLDYVKFDTQSDELTNMTPSTPGQMIFARHLRDILTQMGLSEITLDENGYLMATLEANNGNATTPTVGFIAHLDTSPDMSGRHVNPRIVKNYDGNDITLNSDEGIVLSPTEFPELMNYVGQDLIVTDGTTLLGADDKEIVTAIEYLTNHPEIKHGKIRIAFNPDEEIGLGAHKFDVERFGCDWAYTMDGGFEGELEYENFNAASAKIEIQGRNVHPGYAKGKMINALDVACELQTLLPADQRPQYTEGYEGFYHCVGVNGTVEHASVSYIIRDHDADRFEQKKVFMWACVDLLKKKYGQEVLTLTLKDQYFNMRKMVEPHPQLIDKALEAMRQADVKPIVRPIRGGTDGARLSFMGLPCPNLFTGGMNFHGKFEYCSLTTMHKAMQVVINLARLWAE